MNSKNIYDFVETESTAYTTNPIYVADNYEWSMMEHINTTTLYKNSRYITGNADDKPFKNIIRPILNLQYLAEGFDLKDIVLYVDDSDKYFMSFLVSKFHEKWARDNGIDTVIDQMVESFVDYGGVLLKNVSKVKPEVVKLQSIAFCDQTDIMSGPLGIRHYFSPSQLQKMSKRGWFSKDKGATCTIQDLVNVATESKADNDKSRVKSRTPGKYIEVFEVHGDFPASWLNDGYGGKDGYQPDSNMNTWPDSEDEEYTPQMHIITLHPKKGSTRSGETIFCGPEKGGLTDTFKFLGRDEIFGRALGMGGAEELFESQVWTNYSVIRIKGMLATASKIIFQTADAAFAARNRVDAVENGEILITAPETQVTQINTQPVNLEAFMKSVDDWQTHAQTVGAASDTQLGKDPASGTPFELQKLVNQNGQNLHDRRKGKLAVFWAEVYRDWIIPYIVTEIETDQNWSSDLSLDEIQAIADNVVTLQSNDFIKEKILQGQTINPSEVEQFKQQSRQQFMKGGSKRFMKIMDGELKDAPVDVKIDIAGKQKDLAGMTDKLVNVFQTIISNPGVLQNPQAAKIFNKIIEYSGLSPIDFYDPNPPQQQGQSGPKVAESIAFKDLPPEGQVQMAKQAGITISQPTPQAVDNSSLTKVAQPA